ncbi:MAG: cobalamin-dependent protein [Candidatus Hydrogenedentota bacterium]|nr:MAG: cobalamin-dependent protein [Candidatus Hydrogenedentota bacterium]
MKEKAKALLVNPRVGSTQSLTPHLGLAVLAARLEEAGHTVLVLDYSAERSTPAITHCLEEYHPDFVGITAVTSGAAAVEGFVSQTAAWNRDAIIAVGGPHATLYPEELESVPRLSYIVRGEAEDRIAELVENAVPQSSPHVLACDRPPIQSFPIPSFRSFYNYQNITVYPLLTSKGCPFNCSFCSVHQIASRVWRARRVEDCIEEIRIARRYLPRLRHVRVIDDEPAVQGGRFQQFLGLFAQECRGLSLEIVNLRAKDITEEILGLMKRAGVFEVCFGVEHGSPAVFDEIDKGETLEDIERAAELVKQSGLFLRCCFIVGLPRDSYERTLESIRLAKRIKADFFHWNSFIPLRGTRAADWFKTHGRTFTTKERFSLPGSGGFFVPEPCVETDEFSREEHKKAYVLAILETDSYIITPGGLVSMLQAMVRYKLYGSTIKSLLRQPRCIWNHAIRFHKAGLLYDYGRRYLEDNFLAGKLTSRVSSRESRV